MSAQTHFWGLSREQSWNFTDFMSLLMKRKNVVEMAMYNEIDWRE